jgi:hypothetical protein
VVVCTPTKPGAEDYPIKNLVIAMIVAISVLGGAAVVSAITVASAFAGWAAAELRAPAGPQNATPGSRNR